MQDSHNLQLSKKLIAQLFKDDFEVLAKTTRSGIKLYQDPSQLERIKTNSFLLLDEEIANEDV